jgi:hypothetical protein
MSKLAVAVKNIPKIFKIGASKENAAISAVSGTISKMAGRKIRIHACSPSADIVQLQKALEPLLKKSISEIGNVKDIYIAGSNAAQLTRAMKSAGTFGGLRILESKDSRRGTIGNAITDLENACQTRDKREMERALRVFQTYLARLIQTTLVFVW